MGVSRGRRGGELVRPTGRRLSEGRGRKALKEREWAGARWAAYSGGTRRGGASDEGSVRSRETALDACHRGAGGGKGHRKEPGAASGPWRRWTRTPRVEVVTGRRGWGGGGSVTSWHPGNRTETLSCMQCAAGDSEAMSCASGVLSPVKGGAAASES